MDKNVNWISTNNLVKYTNPVENVYLLTQISIIKTFQILVFGVQVSFLPTCFQSTLCLFTKNKFFFAFFYLILGCSRGRCLPRGSDCEPLCPNNSQDDDDGSIYVEKNNQCPEMKCAASDCDKCQQLSLTGL